MRDVEVLIIGSGAAGLAAALELDRLGVKDVVLCTEGLKRGTSINTGSDKQTYYKLGMYGEVADSPLDMARDLSAGGSMHGDIALAEAALSARGFFNLCNLGVAFPCDGFGQYIGYKTDHDPRGRATSVGPYTSRDMCIALAREVERRGVEICEDVLCVRLLAETNASSEFGVRSSELNSHETIFMHTEGVQKNNSELRAPNSELKKHITGAIFLDLKSGKLRAIRARSVIFAVGGPGALYKTSVYPASQFGAIGLALEIGAEAANLAESQFGLASIKFRWNVSGSYMQVLPRLFSVDEDGVEREFLRDYFASNEELCANLFLKGYQWPFAAGHLPGSSQIDIYVYIESVLKGRRVFLDYRRNPSDFDLRGIGKEAYDYLDKSGALLELPIDRLRALNAPAIELYRDHNIDLEREPLEIAVCAQHNNGGLAADKWWESVNVAGLYPIGEVNGSHGVTRPGGSALNSGQVGALRAARSIYKRIAKRDGSFAAADSEARARFEALASSELKRLCADMERPAERSWRDERREFQERMSECGAFVRSADKVERALKEAEEQCRRLYAGGVMPTASSEFGVRSSEFAATPAASSEFGVQSSEFAATPAASSEFGVRSSELNACKINSEHTESVQKENSELRAPNSELQSLAETLRNRQLALAHWFYLEAIREQIEKVGSRGGSIVLAMPSSGFGVRSSEINSHEIIFTHTESVQKNNSELRAPNSELQENSELRAPNSELPIVPESSEMRGFVMATVMGDDGAPRSFWRSVRPMPTADGWFERVWKDFRENNEE